MAYTSKVTEVAVAIIAVLFLAVAMAPEWTKAQSIPDISDPVCALSIPEIVKHCYLAGKLDPTEECCNDLKTANKREVTCLCDNFIARPSNGNLTRALYDTVNEACGVSDKFACEGSKDSSPPQEDTPKKGLKPPPTREPETRGDANGGTTTKIAASMGLFGLVVSLFL